MIKPDTYSARPWPYGCSLSGCLLATLKPNNEAILEPISDKLFRASALIDKLLEIKETINLKTTKIQLQTIQKIDMTTPYLSLTVLSLVSL